MPEFKFGNLTKEKKMTTKPNTQSGTRVDTTKQNQNAKLKSFKQKFLNWFKTYGGWALMALLAIVIVFIVLAFSARLEEKDEQHKMMLVSERMRIEDTLAKYERTLQTTFESERIKNLFVDYGLEIMRQHYLQNRIPEHRQMRPIEKVVFLEEIYERAASGIYPNAGIPEGLFLPLAYASVETSFVKFNSDGRTPTTGLDGERSIFQFMESTAREVYRRNGRSFISTFWNEPKEYVWLWFEYYSRVESVRFETDDFERHVRWTALAYNAGGGRTGMKHFFDRGASVQEYLRAYPLRVGISDYHQKIWTAYNQYRTGFGAIPLN